LRFSVETNGPTILECRRIAGTSQTEAKAKLAKGAPAGVPAAVFNDIRNGCASKWSEDLTTRVYCENQKTEAFRDLQ
jgi:hypothetical protein